MNKRHILFLLGLLTALAAGGQSFADGMDTNDPVLPPDGVYLSPTDVHAMYTGTDLTIVLSAIQHQPFKDRDPNYLDSPPPGPLGGGLAEHHDFASVLHGHGECIGNCGPIPASFEVLMQGRVQTVAFDKGPGDTTGTFQTEMVSMSLQGFGGMVQIRESPTESSLGTTSITDIGGGNYHIDSFFDVFTEISLDGGASWIPSAGATHVQLVPEPATVVLLALGIAGFAGIARRCHLF